MVKYNHYTEIIKNSYNLILSIIKKAKPAQIGKFLDFFDFKKFSSSFHIYRFKLKNSGKEINLMFMNIIFILVSHFKNSEIIIKLENSVENLTETKEYKILENINLIFKKFYDNSHRKYNEFLKKKKHDLQIQDVLLKIAEILTKYEFNSAVLINSDFLNCVIKFLIEFSNFRTEDVNRGSNNKNINFLNLIQEKKPRLNFEIIKKYCASIILSSLQILNNIINQNDEFFKKIALAVKYFL